MGGGISEERYEDRKTRAEFIGFVLKVKIMPRFPVDLENNPYWTISFLWPSSELA